MSCPVCESNDEIPLPLLIYEGSYWRLEHRHPAKSLGASALILRRHAKALHELREEEWKELKWLLPEWLKLLRTLTNCAHENIESAPCCVGGHLGFQINANGDSSAELPDEAVASFCREARRKYLQRIEDVRVLDVDENLRLRSPQLSDAERLRDLVDANRDYLREWLYWVDYSQTLVDAQEFIRATQEGRHLGSDFVFLMEYQGEVAGCIAILKPKITLPWGEMGYWIAEPFAGKGIVTHSARRLLDYAYETLKLQRVEIRVHPGNVASARIAEHLGASREGVSAKAYMRTGGILEDAVIYSLTK